MVPATAWPLVAREASAITPATAAPRPWVRVLRRRCRRAMAALVLSSAGSVPGESAPGEWGGAGGAATAVWVRWRPFGERRSGALRRDYQPVPIWTRAPRVLVPLMAPVPG